MQSFNFYFYRVNYIELNLEITPTDMYTDMMTYHLSGAGFEMFEETGNGLKAYIQTHLFDQAAIEAIIADVKSQGCEIEYQFNEIPWRNWNEEWESNYQPEIIDNKLYIRAEFHAPNPDYPMEIVVQPRMAFGTGHHPTTSQVMKVMIKTDFTGKSVLDMGSGTGILAILAFMQGASSALAIDNDANAVENSRENAVRNGYPQMEVELGEGEAIAGKKFDVILANINRNIILQDLHLYNDAMNEGSILITSGYYTDDLPVIKNKAAEMGIQYLHHTSENEWCCAVFEKK